MGRPDAERADERDTVIGNDLSLPRGRWWTRLALPPETAIAAHALLDGVASLADKNLVRLSPQVADDSRFGMLETIREYAFDRLHGSGEQPRLERRRAMFLVRLSEDVEANVSPSTNRLDRPERELDNIRAALEWTLSEQGDEVIPAASRCVVPVSCQ